MQYDRGDVVGHVLGDGRGKRLSSCLWDMDLGRRETLRPEQKHDRQRHNVGR